MSNHDRIMIEVDQFADTDALVDQLRHMLASGNTVWKLSKESGDVVESQRLIREIYEAVAAPRSDADPVTLANADTPIPPTNYGLRIYYADDTSDDVDNIDSVQVYDKTNGTFPFVFAKVETEDGKGKHLPGFHRAEDGLFEAFDDRQQPTPGGGW